MKMYCKLFSLLLLKFSDIRQLYAVYVHFIAFLDKLLVEQALEKVFFMVFFG